MNLYLFATTIIGGLGPGTRCFVPSFSPIWGPDAILASRWCSGCVRAKVRKETKKKKHISHYIITETSSALAASMCPVNCLLRQVSMYIQVNLYSKYSRSPTRVSPKQPMTFIYPPPTTGPTQPQATCIVLIALSRLSLCNSCMRSFCMSHTRQPNSAVIVNASEPGHVPRLQADSHEAITRINITKQKGNKM